MTNDKLMVVRKPKSSSQHTKLDIQQSLISMEGRLDAKMDRLVTKIDENAQSFKEYVDIKNSSLRTEMHQNTMSLQQKIKHLGDKLETKIDTNTAGLVNLIETRIGEIIKLEDRVEDHEKRIGVIEEKIS